MTPNEMKLQEMRHDLLFVMSHPMQACKVCAYRDRDCTGAKCTPKWRGDEARGPREDGISYGK